MMLARAAAGMTETPFMGGSAEYSPYPTYGGVTGYSVYDLAKLVQTCYDGDLALLEKMLDREDPVEGYHDDINEHYGECTALHMAAANGQLEVVEMLLKAGADPHVKTCMPYGKDPEEGETAAEIADKYGWDDVAGVLKSAVGSTPKGIYMRYGAKNNSKLYPMDAPKGLDPEQEKRAKAKLKGLTRPLPSKSDRKYYGDAVAGITHGYDDAGKPIRKGVE
mmetsp:Transcript_69307/g.123435  ORF Transcript_69307/g.123435 Transcript_69307/m.123435 type:complete len:221 (-) Transcript_69307:66-728(-)